MTYPFRPTVTAYGWWSKSESKRFPTIRLQVGDHFVIIPIDQARRVVDEVHDLCDEHERGTGVNSWPTGPHTADAQPHDDGTARPTE